MKLETRRLRTKNSSFRLKKIIYIVVLFLLFIFILQFAISAVKLKNVSCKSQYGQCSEYLMQNLNSYVGESYFSSLKNVKNFLLTEPIVDKYTIQFAPPMGVNIDLIEKKASFAIKSNNHEDLFLLDNEGKILNTVPSSALPTLEVERLELQKGDSVSRKVHFALKLTEDVYRIYIVKNSLLNGNSLTVELKTGLKVIFPLEGDREVLIGSLILIYNELSKGEESTLNTNEKNIGTIDLRFKNPVLN